MHNLKALVACGLVAVACVDARGQAGPAGSRGASGPAVSPYLSLLNENNSNAFNYYQLYRPQVEFRNAYRQLNRDVSQLNARVEEQGVAFARMQLGGTGHRTSFMNYGGYFGAGSGGGGLGARNATYGGTGLNQGAGLARGGYSTGRR